ncbi:hypothetical protein CL644_02145 [bacterium]|nr:hypothetical protein [bacterium]|tara:strand:- start:2882 stop:3325 length:444 start_codon:yes stop_codon:yes gene_type:complete
MADIFEKLLGRSDVTSIHFVGKYWIPRSGVTVFFSDDSHKRVEAKDLFDSFCVSMHEWARSYSWLLSLAVATRVPCYFERENGSKPQYLMMVANPDGSYEAKSADGIEILTPSESYQNFYLVPKAWHDSDPRNKPRPNWLRRILRSL